MDVVLPQPVPHEDHVVSRNTVVLAHNNHFVLKERLLYLPTQQPCKAIFLGEKFMCSHED